MKTIHERVTMGCLVLGLLTGGFTATLAASAPADHALRLQLPVGGEPARDNKDEQRREKVVGTAIFARRGDQYLIVTAYHVVRGKSDLIVRDFDSAGNLVVQRLVNLIDGSMTIDPAVDVCVFRCRKEGVSELTGKRFRKRPIELRDNSDVAKRITQALVVGNPDVVLYDQVDPLRRYTYQPLNERGSADVSDQGRAKDKLGVRLAPGKAGDADVLILGSRPVTSGYSGGPVLYSPSRFALDDAVLIGMTQGGYPRSEFQAWAVASTTLVSVADRMPNYRYPPNANDWPEILLASEAYSKVNPALVVSLPADLARESKTQLKLNRTKLDEAGKIIVLGLSSSLNAAQELARAAAGRNAMYSEIQKLGEEMKQAEGRDLGLAKFIDIAASVQGAFDRDEAPHMMNAFREQMKPEQARWARSREEKTATLKGRKLELEKTVAKIVPLKKGLSTGGAEAAAAAATITRLSPVTFPWETVPLAVQSDSSFRSARARLQELGRSWTDGKNSLKELIAQCTREARKINETTDKMDRHSLERLNAAEAAALEKGVVHGATDYRDRWFNIAFSFDREEGVLARDGGNSRAPRGYNGLVHELIVLPAEMAIGRSRESQRQASENLERAGAELTRSFGAMVKLKATISSTLEDLQQIESEMSRSVVELVYLVVKQAGKSQSTF
jgi:hypothetical protein